MQGWWVASEGSHWLVHYWYSNHARLGPLNIHTDVCITGSDSMQGWWRGGSEDSHRRVHYWYSNHARLLGPLSIHTDVCITGSDSMQGWWRGGSEDSHRRVHYWLWGLQNWWGPLMIHTDLCITGSGPCWGISVISVHIIKMLASRRAVNLMRQLFTPNITPQSL